MAGGRLGGNVYHFGDRPGHLGYYCDPFRCKWADSGQSIRECGNTTLSLAWGAAPGYSNRRREAASAAAYRLGTRAIGITNQREIVVGIKHG